MYSVLLRQDLRCLRLFPFTKIFTKSLSGTTVNYLKEIEISTADKVTTVKANYKESPRTPYLVKTGFEDQSCCSLCALNLDIKHTDVLILNQFLDTNGRMLPRRVTQLCRKQQYLVTNLVEMSQRAGLLPGFFMLGRRPLNRYYDEKTVRYPKKHRLDSLRIAGFIK